MSGAETDLTVAVTGPTGTFGFGLMPLLQADERVARVVGIARRPFDPAGAAAAVGARHPAIMDTTRAKQELGWVPRFTALEALRDTLRRLSSSPRAGSPSRLG